MRLEEEAGLCMLSSWGLRISWRLWAPEVYVVQPSDTVPSFYFPWTLKLSLHTSSHPDHGYHVKKHRLSRDPVCCWDPFPRRNLEAHVMHGTRFIFIPGPRDPGPQTLLGGPGHSSDPLSHEQMIQGWTWNIIKQQLMWLFDIIWIIHNYVYLCIIDAVWQYIIYRFFDFVDVWTWNTPASLYLAVMCSRVSLVFRSMAPALRMT